MNTLLKTAAVLLLSASMASAFGGGGGSAGAGNQGNNGSDSWGQSDMDVLQGLHGGFWGRQIEQANDTRNAGPDRPGATRAQRRAEDARSWETTQRKGREERKSMERQAAREKAAREDRRARDQRNPGLRGN
jgi:hypothetical protein